jgi:Raf kinase inhibitor-like YbhB/YbcL family protein
MPIQLISSAFNEGGNIPDRFTCDGANVSPPLAWSGAPNGTESLAIIADDPDAPVGTWVHWVLYNIPAGQTSLAEGAQGVGVQGTNDFRKPGYGGPCPPRGKPHRYFFKVYALDAPVSLKPGGTKADLEKAMQGRILAQGQLMGKYGR